MKWTNRALSDEECREILMEIIKMVIDTYANPIRKGFGARLAQVGYDLLEILRRHNLVCSGEQNQQERMKL